MTGHRVTQRLTLLGSCRMLFPVSCLFRSTLMHTSIQTVLGQRKPLIMKELWNTVALHQQNPQKEGKWRHLPRNTPVSPLVNKLARYLSPGDVVAAKHWHPHSCSQLHTGCQPAVVSAICPHVVQLHSVPLRMDPNTVFQQESNQQI